MGKPTALALARQALRDAVVVDLRRVNDWQPDTFACQVADDAPNVLTSGRYALLSVGEIELALKRISAGESALLLASAVRREAKTRSGRHSLKRRPK